MTVQLTRSVPASGSSSAPPRRQAPVGEPAEEEPQHKMSPCLGRQRKLGYLVVEEELNYLSI